jgi:hypothetical protein
MLMGHTLFLSAPTLLGDCHTSTKDRHINGALAFLGFDSAAAVSNQQQSGQSAQEAQEDGKIHDNRLLCPFSVDRAKSKFSGNGKQVVPRARSSRFVPE